MDFGLNGDVVAKLNHLCLVAGIFFIIIGMTVFAHADDCA